MKLLDSFGFFIFGAIVGAFLYANTFGKPKEERDTMPDINQQVLLERVKKVAKLITIEGEYANIYPYKDYYWADISLLRRETLVKVNAKVSVGYNLEEAQFEIDSINKILRVKNLPEPKILSIDHNLQYYNMSSGAFFPFTEEELTTIGRIAKKKLESTAQNGPLIAQAKEEGLKNLGFIKLLVEQAGWTFEVQNNVITPPPINLLDSIKITINSNVDSLLN